MPSSARRALACALMAAVAGWASRACAEPIIALPEQTSTIRLPNRDVNHIVCQGGEIGDVKYSAEKAIAVERGGSDAWIKFLVKEVDDNGTVTRSFVTTPSEFFINCNDAVYPLYAEPSDIAAQTILLMPGAAQHARANEQLLGPLVEEERAVSITLAMLQDRIPASFAVLAPRAGQIEIATLPALRVHERRRIAVEGAHLAASEYLIEAAADTRLDERQFLVSALGSDIFTVTLDRSVLEAGDSARLIIVRRGAGQ